MRNLYVVAVFVVLQGCAGFNFYDNRDLSPKSKTGIPFYAPKPFALVKRTGGYGEAY